MSDVQVEIDSLEVQLSNNPNNIRSLCRLVELLVKVNKLVLAKEYLDRTTSLYKNTKLSVTQGKEIINCMISYYKGIRYINKTRRLNISTERELIVNEIENIIAIIRDIKDNSNTVLLQLSYIKELQGHIEDSLSLLSDLITEQVNDIDLSYVIFKAAILLQHLGQVRQSIEYLEFIIDDPPIGYHKLHVIAFLAHVYESNGKKYQVFLPKTYKSLMECCKHIEENTLENDKNDEDLKTQQLLFAKLNAKNNNTINFFSQGSEIWELLGLQALERCEYVLALEYLTEAVGKATRKGKLLHMIAEIHTLLKEKEAAIAYAEKAYLFLPQSRHLRNLLLHIAPDVWTEKLRSVAPIARKHEIVEHEDDDVVHHENIDEDDDEDFDLGAEYGFGGGSGYGSTKSFRGDRVTKRFDPEIGQISPSKSFRDKAVADQSSWVKNMRTKAGEALKAVNSGASISDAIAVAKSAGNTRVPLSSSTDRFDADSPSLAPKPATPKPDTKTADKNNKDRRSPSPTRDKEKSNQINSNKYPSINTSKIRRIKSNDAKDKIKNKKDKKSNTAKSSPSKNNQPSADQQHSDNAVADAQVEELAVASADNVPSPCAENLESKEDGAGDGLSRSLSRTLSGRLSRDPSAKLSPDPTPPVEEKPSRPIKPVLDDDAKKMLKLILSGNTNIPVYDPNMKIIMEMRSGMSAKKTM